MFGWHVLDKLAAAALLSYFLAACSMHYEIVRADWGTQDHSEDAVVIGIRMEPSRPATPKPLPMDPRERADWEGWVGKGS
jgi:hypothetical protein